MLVHERVYKCEIILTEWVLPAEPRGPRQLFNTFIFESVDALATHLKKNTSYKIALSLGYMVKTVPPDGTYSHVRIGRLGLFFKDNYNSVTLEFDNVGDFVKFLEEHPALAQHVGYQPKKQKR